MLLVGLVCVAGASLRRGSRLHLLVVIGIMLLQSCSDADCHYGFLVAGELPVYNREG